MGGGGTGTTRQLHNLLDNPHNHNSCSSYRHNRLWLLHGFPEIRNTRRTCEQTKNEPVLGNQLKSSATDAPISNVAPNSCKVILKTMTPEEQKVLNTLIAHQGKYLQKYVGKEAGLSRLKTHRIVARFAERGIVTVKPAGKHKRGHNLRLGQEIKDPKLN